MDRYLDVFLNYETIITKLQFNQYKSSGYNLKNKLIS